MITEQDVNDDYPVIPETDLIQLAEGRFRPYFTAQDPFADDCAYLAIELPLAVTDNHCHASGKGGHRYATATYKAWLQHCAPLLQELLGDWQPDTWRWWAVSLELWIGSTQDGPNYTKPILDLLSGARVVPEAFNAPNGKRIGKGDLWHYGGLWDDDRRVAVVNITVRATRHPTPYAQVTAWQTTAPVDYRAQQAEEAKQQREKARQVAQEARQQAKDALKAVQAKRKREDEQKRTLCKPYFEWVHWLNEYPGKEFASVRSKVKRCMQARHVGPVSVTFTPGEWAKLNGGAE